jgi:hypothetical protein
MIKEMLHSCLFCTYIYIIVEMPGVNPSCFQSSLVLRNMAGLIPALHNLSNNFINRPYPYKLSLLPQKLYQTFESILHKVLSLGDGTDL